MLGKREKREIEDMRDSKNLKKVKQASILSMFSPKSSLKKELEKNNTPKPERKENKSKYMRLERDFFKTDVVTLSKKLLGKVICRNLEDGTVLRSRIVETEAYKAPEDKGCHAYNNKRTKRTEAFWCNAGCWYVYTIYMKTNKCLNVVAADTDSPEAVLIRAAEPLEGIGRMQKFTNKVGKNKPADIRGLTNGPGKLGNAMDIGTDYTQYDFCVAGNDAAYIEQEAGYTLEEDDIVDTFRINLGYAEEWRFKKWRFFIKGHKSVSKKEQTKDQILKASK